MGQSDHEMDLPREVPVIGAGPIVSVADGSDRTDAALVAAALLSGRTGAEVDVLAVCEVSGGSSGSGPFPGEGVPGASAGRCRVLGAAVEQQLADVVGEVAGWPVAALEGAPGPVVRRVAVERHARMVIVTQHRSSEATGPEQDAVVQILEYAVTPVYVAIPPVSGIPSCAVVAVDFGAASVWAAHVAGSILSDGGMMYLVHVTPSALQTRQLHLSAARRADVLAALARLAISLAPSVTIRVRPTVLSGPVAEQVLSFARGVRADLIACGTKAGGAACCSPDTITAALLHNTVCSMVVTPHRPYDMDA